MADRSLLGGFLHTVCISGAVPFPAAQQHRVPFCSLVNRPRRLAASAGDLKARASSTPPFGHVIARYSCASAHAGVTPAERTGRISAAARVAIQVGDLCRSAGLAHDATENSAVRNAACSCALATAATSKGARERHQHESAGQRHGRWPGRHAQVQTPTPRRGIAAISGCRGVLSWLDHIPELGAATQSRLRRGARRTKPVVSQPKPRNDHEKFTDTRARRQEIWRQSAC